MARMESKGNFLYDIYTIYMHIMAMIYRFFREHLVLQLMWTNALKFRPILKMRYEKDLNVLNQFWTMGGMQTFVSGTFLSDFENVLSILFGMLKYIR